jgi:hypothetical protein
MLFTLMIFCAAGAIFLMGLAVYAEFRELWARPGSSDSGGGGMYPTDPREIGAVLKGALWAE